MSIQNIFLKEINTTEKMYCLLRKARNATDDSSSANMLKLSQLPLSKIKDWRNYIDRGIKVRSYSTFTSSIVNLQSLSRLMISVLRVCLWIPYSLPYTKPNQRNRKRASRHWNNWLIKGQSNSKAWNHLAMNGFRLNVSGSSITLFSNGMRILVNQI